MATTGSRKSSRKSAKQNANEGEAPARVPEGPNEPFGAKNEPADRFLRQMYQEIHDTSMYGLEDEMRTRVQDILRRTRSRRFWASVSDGHKAAYRIDPEVDTDAMNDTAPANFGTRGGVEIMRQEKLDNAIAAFSHDTRPSAQIDDDMLADLVERCGYPLLSICLHSETFLQYAETSDDDYKNTKDRLLSADARVSAIEEAHASLELFAKVRRLDFLTPIRAYDEDLELLLSNIFKPYNTISHRRDLGIRDGDMREIHKIDSWDLIGKYWALPVDTKSPAEMCSVTYQVTEYVKRDYPELGIGDELTEPQEDINDSVLLKGYDWPHMNDWPADDPREDGYDEHCICCNHIRGAVPKPRTAGEQPKTCNCTLKDLQFARLMPRDKQGVPRDVLFEIAKVKGLGNGVRALQNFHEGDVAGIYIGEMYPRSTLTQHQLNSGKYEVDGSNWILPRYGGEQGGKSYLMDQYMAPHRHRKLARPQSQGPPKGKKRTQKQKKQKTKRRQNSGDDDDENDGSKTLGPWLPLERTEYRHYVVDSALRGNWTRYLNHNCDPNFNFERTYLGCKFLVAIQCVRDVPFGEWMTVDYGQDYFVDFSGGGCLCGMENCLNWNSKNRNGETRTLGEVMEEGKGPSWAKNTEGVPLPATKAGKNAAKVLKRQRQRQTNRRDGQGDGDDQNGEDEEDSAKDATKTGRSTKRSKAAAQSARDARDAAKDAAEPPAPTRRSKRQEERRAQMPQPVPAATAAPSPAPTPAKHGTKRSALSAATGPAKKTRKR